MLGTVEFDFLAPEVLRNLHPALAALRAEAPVYRLQHVEMGMHPWMLTRYDDCIALLTDERFTKDSERLPGRDPDRHDPMEDAANTINRHMLTLDPPDHTRLRALVHKAFTPRRISLLVQRIQQISDGLIDRMLARGQAELIADFALPLPITVIAELLGIPTDEQTRFRRWSQTIITGGANDPTADVGAVVLEFIMYFHEMFDQRRADPRDDLITALVQVEDTGDKLQPQELISMIFLLLAAGHETTVNLIGNGTLALLQHADQLEKLRANPGLITSAVEELLRFEGPLGISTMRWALQDLELRGQPIRAGQMVVASLLGANRDPAVFERPDALDITRAPNRHIAFGHGIHYCLGAPLARLEGAIAINTLARRVPKLALAVDPDEIMWNQTLLLHGVKALPVTV